MNLLKGLLEDWRHRAYEAAKTPAAPPEDARGGYYGEVAQ